jgi:hypothetical protein
VYQPNRVTIVDQLDRVRRCASQYFTGSATFSEKENQAWAPSVSRWIES